MLTSTVFLSALLIGLIIGFVVLLVLQLLTSSRVNRLTAPIYEYALSKAQTDADRIVQEAQEKARALIVDAQTKSDALASRHHEEMEGRAKAYRATLDVLESSMKSSIEESVQTARREQTEVAQSVTEALRSHVSAFEQHLAETEKGLDAFTQEVGKQAQEARTTLTARATAAAQRLEKTFDDTATESRTQIDKRLEEMFAHVEGEIDAYREGRKRLIDMHMAELVGETAKVVLHKTLSTNDHTALVEQALEEAKSTGAL